MLGLEGVYHRVFGTRSDRILKKMHPTVVRIKELEPKMKALSNAELKALTPEFRQRLENGMPIDDLLPETFAAIREVGWRTLQMRHFDVQMLGGIVLHRGMSAEMKTGEGKTLVATLPVYLNALTGQGVHVVTVNDYLASRDADWMGKIYKFMGLSVGKVLSKERDQEVKKEAYTCDVTYGTNNEFGFDYLRDNMKFRAEDYVQRGHHYAIVDEVDSILIDEARTPLIISGPTGASVERYYIIDGVIPLLQAELDYIIDEKQRSVSLTDPGVDKVEQKLGVDNIYDPHNMEVLHHVNQALKAHTLFKRDRDYVVQQGKVIIVDEHTGRLMVGRRWSDGLHQAVEAKEKLEVETESQTYATITFQNYFRMYTKLAGMTGTAETEAEEFQKIYNLDVVVVPTNQPAVRKDLDDLVYKTQAEKYRAVLDDIESCHQKGQPVLVGTVSVEKSEIVSRLIQTRGIPHKVLNARYHWREADIVAQAGRKGGVTISTNMAGRGTDIKLGGDPEGMARLEVVDELFGSITTTLGISVKEGRDGYYDKRCDQVLGALAILSPFLAENPDDVDWNDVIARVRGALIPVYGRESAKLEELADLLAGIPDKARTAPARWRATCEAEREEMLAAGGLHILGTERHESRRIDNQLRGRSGRQGDPGTSRFYMSLEDDLLRIFGGEKLVGWMEKMGLQDDEPIEHRWINRSIENAQKKVEGHNFNIRKNLLEYDDVMNLQRKAVYEMRRRALMGEAIREMVVEACENLVDDILDECVDQAANPESWNIAGLRERMGRIFGVEWSEGDDEIRDMAYEEIRGRIVDTAMVQYEAKEEEVGGDQLRQVERMLLLQFTDQHWKDHLLAMDRLRDGIGLRGYGQKNPLLEYKREGTDMFLMMNSMRDEAVVSRLLRMQLQEDEIPEVSKGAARQLASRPIEPGEAEGGEQPQVSMDEVRARLAGLQAQQATTQQATRAEAPARPEPGEQARAFAEEHGFKRNDPCPCGSGRKFKKCCYERPSDEEAPAPA